MVINITFASGLEIELMFNSDCITVEHVFDELMKVIDIIDIDKNNIILSRMPKQHLLSYNDMIYDNDHLYGLLII
jgi:hypothetical protein